jgi:hypothetical protein
MQNLFSQKGIPVNNVGIGTEESFMLGFRDDGMGEQEG